MSQARTDFRYKVCGIILTAVITSHAIAGLDGTPWAPHAPEPLPGPADAYSTRHATAEGFGGVIKWWLRWGHDIKALSNTEEIAIQKAKDYLANKPTGSTVLMHSNPVEHDEVLPFGEGNSVQDAQESEFKTTPLPRPRPSQEIPETVTIFVKLPNGEMWARKLTIGELDEIRKYAKATLGVNAQSQLGGMCAIDPKRRSKIRIPRCLTELEKERRDALRKSEADKERRAQQLAAEERQRARDKERYRFEAMERGIARGEAAALGASAGMHSSPMYTPATPVSTPSAPPMSGAPPPPPGATKISRPN